MFLPQSCELRPQLRFFFFGHRCSCAFVEQLLRLSPRGRSNTDETKLSRFDGGSSSERRYHNGPMGRFAAMHNRCLVDR
jgi:hypothetical protein